MNNLTRIKSELMRNNFGTTQSQFNHHSYKEDAAEIIVSIWL
jgi:hypothetical protein